MGGKEKKKTNTLIDQERNRQLNESDNTRAYLEPERRSEKEFADSLRGDITKGYQNFANYPLGGESGAGGGGGFSAPRLSLNSAYKKLEPRYGKLSKGIDEALGGYRDFAKTGGITDEMRDRIRGAGVFDEFARTGGYSEGDKSNIRARGIAPIDSFYGNLKNELQRRQGVQGGYGAGYDSASSKMARDAAISSGDLSRDTEIDIMDRVLAGRMQGAGALSDAEQYYSGAMQQGRLAGLGGMTDIGKFGYGGLENIAGIRQQISNANRQSAASASNANRNSALAQQQYADRMRLTGLGGLESVYGSSPAELSRYDTELYRNRGLTGDNVNTTLGLRSGQNSGPSGWDRAIQIGSIAAGVGGAAFTGGASMAIPAAAGAIGPIWGAAKNNKQQQNDPYFNGSW